MAQICGSREAVRVRTNNGVVEKHLYEYSGGWAWLRTGYSWKVARLEFGLDTVNDAAAFQAGIRKTGAVLLRPLNVPARSLLNEAHLISASPPIVELAGERNPHFRLTAKLGEAGHQGGGNSTGTLF